MINPFFSVNELRKIDLTYPRGAETQVGSLTCYKSLVYSITYFNLEKFKKKIIMTDINKCNNVECENIGRKVTANIEINGKMETHDIYLCQICINLVNASNGGLKN